MRRARGLGGDSSRGRKGHGYAERFVELLDFVDGVLQVGISGCYSRSSAYWRAACNSARSGERKT